MSLGEMFINKAFLFNEMVRFETSVFLRAEEDKHFDLGGDGIKLHFEVYTPLIIYGLKSM
jgi:hypothetical protein